MKPTRPLLRLSVVAVFAALSALTPACQKPDPARTVSVAVASEVRKDIEPLLKTPNAFKGYRIIVLSGPAKSLHQRIAQDGFAPDILITADLTDMMSSVFPQYVAEPYPFAQKGSLQIVAVRLKQSIKIEAFRAILDFLQGAEGAARLKEAGYTPVPKPGQVDPNDVVYGKDGAVRIPVTPGTQVGQSYGSK